MVGRVERSYAASLDHSMAGKAWWRAIVDGHGGDGDGEVGVDGDGHKIQARASWGSGVKPSGNLTKPRLECGKDCVFKCLGSVGDALRQECDGLCWGCGGCRSDCVTFGAPSFGTLKSTCQ